MKMFRNRLLVPLVLITVLTAVLGASVCAASPSYRSHATTKSSTTLLKPGAGRMSGEPDAGGGTLPLPKDAPNGTAISVAPDSPLWIQMLTAATMRFWFAIRTVRG